MFRQNYFTDPMETNLSEQWKHDLKASQAITEVVCEIFRRGLLTIIAHDVNSMYVKSWGIVTSPTHQGPIMLKRNKILSLLHDNEHLMIDCDIVVHRTKSLGSYPLEILKTKKLIFPTGSWRGVYTGIELRAAIRYGAQIRHYPQGFTLPRIGEILCRFCHNDFRRSKTV